MPQGRGSHSFGRTFPRPGFAFPRGAEMPAGLQFPLRTDVWTPLVFDSTDLRNYGTQNLSAIGKRNAAVYGHYDQAIDRESAYERLKGKVAASGAGVAAGGVVGGGTVAGTSSGGGWLESAGAALGGVLGSGGSRRGDTVVQAMVKSAARRMGSTVGRQIIRGVLGSLLGGSSGSRR